jgi:hypothetical protein
VPDANDQNRDDLVPYADKDAVVPCPMPQQPGQARTLQRIAQLPRIIKRRGC